MTKYYTYSKKIDALKELEKMNTLDIISSKNNKYNLFGYDLDNMGSKRFIICTYEMLYNDIKNEDGTKNYYEYYKDDETIKLFFDIDCKIENNGEEDNKDTFFEKILVFLKEILIKLNLDLEKERMIVLSACTNKKYSFHIIFPKIILPDVKSFKNFLINIESELLLSLIHI
jgi:hypothetical protein